MLTQIDEFFFWLLKLPNLKQAITQKFYEIIIFTALNRVLSCDVLCQQMVNLTIFLLY